MILFYIRVETESDGTRKRTGGEVKGKKTNGGGSQQSCPVSDTVYPALLPLMRILRLLAADWSDTPADKNGLVHFAERPNLVSARVPPHSVFTIPTLCTNYLFWYIHYTPQHVSSTIVLIFRRTIVLVQHLLSSLSLGDCSVQSTRGLS